VRVCLWRQGKKALGSGAGVDSFKASLAQVFRYMKEHGLPDESCLTYNATDHTKFDGLNLTSCPSMSQCLNCMPLQTPNADYSVNTCWPVDTPIKYQVLPPTVELPTLLM
jgi:cathepsin X